MKNIELIIHGTFTNKGQDIIFNEELINSLDNKSEILVDERKEVSQFSKKKDVFSIYRDNEKKVYSYINTKISDFASRQGFYAIRLIVNPDEIIFNPKENLLKIANSFENHRINKSFSNQNYDNIINQIKLGENPVDTIVASVNNNTFYKFSTGGKINEVLNDEDLSGVKRLYVFEKDITHGGQSDNMGSMLPIENYKQSLRKIQVKNPNRYLNAILVNNDEVKFKNKKDFLLLCNKEDNVHYIDNKNLKKHVDKDDEIIDIQLSESVSKGGSKGRTKKTESNVINYILFTAIGLLLGGLGGFYITKFFEKDVEEPEIVNIVSEPEQISFKLNPQKKNDIEFSIEGIEELREFEFKWNAAKKKWEFRKNVTNSFEDLDQNKINDYINNDSVRLVSIISAIENFTGENIPEEIKTEIDEKESEVNKETHNNNKQNNPQTHTPVQNTSPETQSKTAKRSKQNNNSPSNTTTSSSSNSKKNNVKDNSKNKTESAKNNEVKEMKNMIGDN